MTIGIIGAGALGSTLARAFAIHGISASIANSRGPETLSALVRELGPNIKAVTTEEAAKADIVILAVRWGDIEGVLRALPAWGGRILVDGSNPLIELDPASPQAQDKSNPLTAMGIQAVDTGGRLSSEVVRDFASDAKLVKAFNHFEVEHLLKPDVAGGTRAAFYSGDDDDAKVHVRKLIEQIGLFPVDLGYLSVGGALASMPFGSLSGFSFAKI